MTRQRVEQCGFLAVVLTIVSVSVFFTWPNYSKASGLSAKADALDLKIGRLEDAEQDVQQREASLQRLQSEHDAICLHVPDRPDVANLMNHLSVGVDGVAVRVLLCKGTRTTRDSTPRAARSAALLTEVMSFCPTRAPVPLSFFYSSRVKPRLASCKTY